MKMYVGNNHKDGQALDARFIRFVTDDGREAFEVRPGKDGRSVEIRGIDTFFVNHVAYGAALTVAPEVSNFVIVQAREYDRP